MSNRTRALSARWRKDLETLCELHGMTFEQAQTKQRFRVYLDARAACYRYLRNEGWSYPEIGGLFGRDHTSIMYAICTDQERRALKLERSRRAYARQLERRRAA